MTPNLNPKTPMPEALNSTGFSLFILSAWSTPFPTAKAKAPECPKTQFGFP